MEEVISATDATRRFLELLRIVKQGRSIVVTITGSRWPTSHRSPRTTESQSERVALFSPRSEESELRKPDAGRVRICTTTRRAHGLLNGGFFFTLPIRRIHEIDAPYSDCVREQIEEAELDTHQPGTNPHHQVLTLQQAGRDHR